jgi:hypothetical protein
MPEKTRPERLAGRTRGLLRCGMWAGPAFAAAFLAEGAVRDGYRPLRHPVSSLALGPRGWTQTANFAVTGVLCLAGAAGLRLAGDRPADSRAGPVMVAAAGVGLIASAAFRTDPVGGYPPGTPDVPARGLCSGGRLVLLDDAGRDAAAVLDLDALLPGPLADLGGVDGGAAAPGAGCGPGRAAGPPGVREVLLQCLAELVVVRGAEVDLVFRAVQAEADGAGRLAAVEVVNEQGLNSLGHERNPNPLP